MLADFHFVVNTVGMVDPAINDTLASIASLDPRGAILDTLAHRDMEPARRMSRTATSMAMIISRSVLQMPSSSWILFIAMGSGTTYTITFVNVDDTATTYTVDAGVVLNIPQVWTPRRVPSTLAGHGSSSADATYTALYEVPTYEITFINVDDTQEVQTVNAGVVATPPAGVDTATRTFTGWPTVAAASADATYTALYDVVTYEITFVNVDDTLEVQTVNAGVVATPPQV